MRVEGYNGEFLSKNDIIEIHNSVLQNAGTSNILDNGRFLDGTGKAFDAAVNGILAGFGGIDLYPSIVDKSSALCYNIITSHVFRDGNKRVASLSLITMLDINNLQCSLTDEELANITVLIAEHKMDYNEFNDIINRSVELKGTKNKNISTSAWQVLIIVI